MAKPSSNSGNDTLSGLNGSGKLVGGNGDDTYIIDDAGDEVVERRNGGTDHVMSYISYRLPSNVEILTLLGTDDLWGAGNELDNVINGNSGANELEGLAGNDRLDGGAGDDRLLGGDGDDTLIGGDGNDFIDGGDGADLAIFAGASTDYGFQWYGDVLRITRETGDGTVESDELMSVETLQFDDGLFATDAIRTASLANDAPVASDDLATGPEDHSIVIDVLANDSDPDNDGLSVSGVGAASHGTVSINPDGTITYSPFADFNGVDSFSYTISDGHGHSATAAVTVEVEAVNDPLIAVDDAYTAVADQALSPTVGVLANDYDVDGDTCTVASCDSVSDMGGTVSMRADGTFTYTPAAGFVGTDSFAYVVQDGNGGTSTGNVTVAVEAPPDPDALPYYVEGLLYGEDYKRLNYPDVVGRPVTVTYTFLQEVPDYYSSTSTIRDSFRAFSEQQEQVARDALDLIESFSNLTFTEVTSAGEATIAMGLYDLGGDNLGAGTYPVGAAVGDVYSDLWIDTELAGDSFVLGTEAFYVLLHEIGHAIGIDHPDLPAVEETRQYTVMDYSPHPTMSGDVTGYQLYDIAALQHLYGAGTDHATGDDVYGFSAFDGVITTIWDAGGQDTFDLSAATYAVQIDLREGAFSTITATGSNNVAIAFDTVIEVAIGGAHNDTLSGNDVANVLNGGGGDDQLIGGGGADTFVFDARWGRDVIADFTSGEDLLDFRESGATAADLVITSDGTDTQIAFSDHQVTLFGVDGVTQSDFHWEIA